MSPAHIDPPLDSQGNPVPPGWRINPEWEAASRFVDFGDNTTGGLCVGPPPQPFTDAQAAPPHWDEADEIRDAIEGRSFSTGKLEAPSWALRPAGGISRRRFDGGKRRVDTRVGDKKRGKS